MVLSSSSSCSYLFMFLLLSTLFSKPAARELRDLEMEFGSPKISPRLGEKMLMEGGYYPRLKLHEVHSGPNPVSNSHPSQNMENRIPRTP